VLVDLAPGNERDRLTRGHLATSSRKSSDNVGGP